MDDIIIALIIFGGMIMMVWYQAQGGSWERDQEIAAERYSHNQHVKRNVRKWRKQGSTIRFGPMPARYNGSLPEDKQSLTGDGGLAIVNRNVVFARDHGHDIHIALDSIRWVNPMGTTLVVEDHDHWKIHKFAFDDGGEFERNLQTIGNISPLPYAVSLPVTARRLEQDIYGQWTRGDTVTLYLLPDRVLVNWRTKLLIDQIREVAVVDVPTRINRRNRDLLRITYEASNGERITIGYVTDDGTARRWAQVLHERSDAPLEIIAGRKKKQV